MDDVATARSENANLRKIRNRLLQWEAKSDALAALNPQQEDCIETLANAWNDDAESTLVADSEKGVPDGNNNSYKEIQTLTGGIHATNDFLLWYDRVHDEIHQHSDVVYHRYLQQLEMRGSGCRNTLEQIDLALQQLETLNRDYQFVSQKTSALNTSSEQLIEEQKKLQQVGDEIQRRLHYFNQVELLQQRLQSPTLSVASEAFSDCLNRIDECLGYLRVNPKFKDSDAFTVKYQHCLAKAITLMKHFTSAVLSQANNATLQQKKPTNQVNAASGKVAVPSITDAAFALYYGKYQTSAVKFKCISTLVEARIQQNQEYEQLLAEMRQNYFTERAAIISPAIDKAIKDLKLSHKGDHCSLMRSACRFLMHVCQDEQSLYYQFFTLESEQLTVYLEGLCNILYDTMRPFIIHVNHLETLAEICSILRIEMIEGHVQQNPKTLEAFANTLHQLLQDVQERLVFRAHLYLQSDILNYNPSAGDLAYPDKLEMMESIALSLHEGQNMKRFDSRSSLVSIASSQMEHETAESTYRARNMNSPADLHGMWYPTVRRTLVCLSRLYRCVDRPVFQGLSQEALKLCIQSVSAAAGKISLAKSKIDGELFEIKHLLILREQIAPFRVDFTIKETSLDFSKVKTAAYGLLQKRKQLFTMGSNNALLEFLLDGTPLIKEHLLDSRKEVDRQLKTACEHFIKHAVDMLAEPIVTFLEKAQSLVTIDNKNAGDKQNVTTKVNYALRQSTWASPQQISSVIQETQRLIKTKLPILQRSMQLYLSNRDTEFIIFRPIRNNIIQTFVKLEQLLTTNGYTADDMTITSCPSAEQISILLSSASILAAESIINFAGTTTTTPIIANKPSVETLKISAELAAPDAENLENIQVPSSPVLESNDVSVEI